MSGAGKRPEIERGPLRDLLLESLHPNTVQWDCKLESAELQGEQVLLRFAGGQIALADLAVGCDGANSRLRELVTPIRPKYVGVSLVEGLVPGAKQMIPELWDLLGGSALIALGGERPVATPRGVAWKRQAGRSSEWHGFTPTSRGGARYGSLFSRKPRRWSGGH